MQAPAGITHGNLGLIALFALHRNCPRIRRAEAGLTGVLHRSESSRLQLACFAFRVHLPFSVSAENSNKL
jgi:hypothetical protein